MFYVWRDYVSCPYGQRQGATTTDIANRAAQNIRNHRGQNHQVTIRQITSPQQFTELWREMFNSGVVYDVKIIGHGSIAHVGNEPGSFMSATGSLTPCLMAMYVPGARIGVAFLTMPGGRFYARSHGQMGANSRSVADLQPVTMKNLTLIACNQAHRGSYNMVYGMGKRHNITGFITGVEGGAVFRFSDNRLVVGGATSVVPSAWRNPIEYARFVRRNATWYSWRVDNQRAGVRTFRGSNF